MTVASAESSITSQERAISSAPIACLEGVSKKYQTRTGTIQAVSDVSLNLYPGELITLLGVSGSGKTSLIGILAGLTKPDQGRAVSCGYDLHGTDKELAEYRLRAVSVVYQEYNLLGMLTAVENVALPGRLRGQPLASAVAQAHSSLRSVGLATEADRRPRDLSGGQRQRVAIARALAGGSPLVLADEPSGSLDSRNSREVARLLRRVSDEGAAVVVATHDPIFVEVADRVGTIMDGHLDWRTP